MFSFWDYGTQFYELYHLIITFCLLSDQVHQGAILRKPGGVCQAMAVKWQFANACKVSVTEGGGTRGQAGSGGSAMPPIPGAGGKTLSWAPGLLAVCGGWPGGVRHSVWIMAQPAPSQTSDQCQLPVAWERPEWASWPRVSVRGPGAHRGQVTITELPAHWEPELGLVSGCLSWELRAESGTQEFLEECSPPAASSAPCQLQLSPRLQAAAARAAHRGKPVLQLEVAVVGKFATISHFFHPFSASRQFQREGET